MAITSIDLPAGPTMLFGQDPKFVNSDADDFHLQPTSPALDFAPISTPDQPLDLDGLPRNQNLSTVTDRFGPRDLGAYERQPCSGRNIGSCRIPDLSAALVTT